LDGSPPGGPYSQRPAGWGEPEPGHNPAVSLLRVGTRSGVTVGAVAWAGLGARHVEGGTGGTRAQVPIRAARAPKWGILPRRHGDLRRPQKTKRGGAPPTGGGGPVCPGRGGGIGGGDTGGLGPGGFPIGTGPEQTNGGRSGKPWGQGGGGQGGGERDGCGADGVGGGKQATFTTGAPGIGNQGADPSGITRSGPRAHDLWQIQASEP